MLEERITGSFYSWSPRGFAMIFVTPQKRYFMHISEFKSDHIPFIGEEVSFLARPPRKGGQLPLAIDVRPVPAGGAQ
jgi:hypothetical protein